MRIRKKDSSHRLVICTCAGGLHAGACLAVCIVMYVWVVLILLVAEVEYAGIYSAWRESGSQSRQFTLLYSEVGKFSR